VNDFLTDAIRLIAEGAERDDLFARAKALSLAFSQEDTEEREKVDDYIGETMRIIGLVDWSEHV
jgi:hypothetical protein